MNESLFCIATGVGQIRVFLDQSQMDLFLEKTNNCASDQSGEAMSQVTSRSQTRSVVKYRKMVTSFHENESKNELICD